MKEEICSDPNFTATTGTSNCDDFGALTNGPYFSSLNEAVTCESPLKLKLSCNENGTPLFVFPANSYDEQNLRSMKDCTNLVNLKQHSSYIITENDDNCTGGKFRNVSLDCVQTKKECPLISCPSLDSSLATKQNGTFLPLVKPLTATPSSGLISRASLDSGVLSSALSIDLVTASNENGNKRSRTASSVSSGTSDMWQSSMEGDVTAPMTVPESLVQVTGTKVAEPPLPSFLKKSARNENLSSCLSTQFMKQSSTTSNNLNETARYNLNSDNYYVSDILASKCSKEDEPIKFSSKSLLKMEQFAAKLVELVISEALTQSVSMDWSIKCSGQCNQKSCREDFKKQSSEKLLKSKFSTLGLSNCNSSLCWTPEIPFSPSHRSKRSSLSFSHDSLVSTGPTLDDSHLITGAVSHDALAFSNHQQICSIKKKSKNCSDCLNTEIYSMPIDMITSYRGPILHPKVITRQPKHRIETRSSKCSMSDSSERRNSKVKRIHRVDSQRKNAAVLQNEFNEVTTNSTKNISKYTSKIVRQRAIVEGKIAAESAGRGTICSDESQKFTSQTAKLSLILPSFSSTKNSKQKDDRVERKKNRSLSSNIRNTLVTLFSFRKSHSKDIGRSVNAANEFIDPSRDFYDSSDGVKWGKICPLPSVPPLRKSTGGSAFSDLVPASSLSPPEPKSLSSYKIFSQRPSSSIINPSSLFFCLGHPRTSSIDYDDRKSNRESSDVPICTDNGTTTVKKRALPPLPSTLKDEGCDFASIIEKVKDYGWYWGPISGEAAEKVLSNEPDGSFIVRDSSDYHYIFSLTFRLDEVTRHVRIEHDQGNFSFGGFTRFKSQTIVDFIEKAVEHSRSGRYLFFLHRRPVLGPMRVQLLHPVSRFKHVQSLQHMCRFVIVKHVRKDLIPSLPLPQRLKDYLNSPHYYSEQVELCMSADDLSSPTFCDDRTPLLPSAADSSTHLLLNIARGFSIAREMRPLRCRDTRSRSSHSSLESSVQASALPANDRAWRKNAPYSSPSSPVSFDLATDDWVSSTEEIFRFSQTAPLVPRSPRQRRRSFNFRKAGSGNGTKKNNCLSGSNGQYFAAICDKSKIND